MYFVSIGSCAEDPIDRWNPPSNVTVNLEISTLGLEHSLTMSASTMDLEASLLLA